MILGISSFAYGWWAGVKNARSVNPLSENDLLLIARKHGLHCIQFGDNLPVHQFDIDRRETLKRNIIDGGIRIELGARGLTADHLHTYIELAKFFNAPLVRFVIDEGPYEPSISSVADIIEDFIPMLEKESIVLGIENHDRFKATELVFLMESLGSRHVGICLDTVNSLGAGEGLDHVAELLSPYTVNLHIKDFTVQRVKHSMGLNVTGVPAGLGFLNTFALVEKLQGFHRCPSAVLEQWVPFQNDLDTTIALEQSWAEESLNHLKTISLFEFQRTNHINK
ncbi:TIM barrel protein [Chryseolinea sp. T2]|uniref:sugar phosphate isomerase/epimerase family protein n=1 Tax=Chryseolinea sp. T2 TaxID=3129255 RepID=UPI003078386E